MNSKRSLLTLAALAATMTLSAPAFAQAGGGQLERLLQADSNGDGAVSRTEAQAMREAAFTQVDANGDGYITTDERPARAQQQGLGARRGGDLMERADANGDGRVSRQEYLGQPMRAFERFDANGDDVLSASELETLRATLARFANRN